MATFSGEVHPVAAMFPMLDEDELNELAADIKANGLLYDIVLDDDGMLIDGRNRLAACQKAKVKPRFATLNGTDPVAYILATNIARRHLTKGQRAMAVSKARLLLNNNQDSASKGADVSRGYVAKADVVVEFAPDLADDVLSGAVPLNDAYDEARKRKRAGESRDEQLAELQANAKDLLDLVVEERMSLTDAIAAQGARKQKVLDEQRDARALLTRIVDLAAPTEGEGDWLDAWAQKLGVVGDDLATRTRQAGKLLLALSERLTK